MKNKTGLLIGFLCVCSTLFAQRQTASPLSRYGYGNFYSYTNAYNQALGGIGVGTQNKTQLNFLNPAQQSAIKGETFLFNVGLGGDFRTIEDNALKNTTSSVGLESFSFAFPIIAERWGAAVGLLPFNSVGYSIQTSDSLTRYKYSGTGGTNQVAFSTGCRVFKGLSLGVQASYMFGTTDYTGENYFEESGAYYTRKNLEYKTNGFLWNAGIQYKYDINESYSFVIGATFRTMQQLSYKATTYFGSYTTGGVTETQKDTATLSSFSSTTDIPTEFAVGMSFSKENTYLLGVDFGMQDWKNISCYGKVDNNLEQTKYVKFGGEYIPDYKSSKFYKRTPIRVGFHYSELPIIIQHNGENAQIQEYGISLGSRIKSKQTQNRLELSLDFGKRGNSNLAKYLQETYIQFKLNVTLQEVWFTKRKIN